MSNKSMAMYFVFVGFFEVPELHTFYFEMFLIFYVIALMGNLLIITIVTVNNHLHTPMYFFVLNLSLVDLGFITVTIPKFLVGYVMRTREISYSHCAAQVFFFSLFGASEFFLLTVMSIDRYVAICRPLEYEIVINKNRCIQMASCVWTAGILTAILHTVATFASYFCSNVIHNFFCEVAQLLRLACSDTYLIEFGAIALTASSYFICFIFIVMSYVQIFRAVLRIPFAHGRQKAFSTCLPHLIVLSMYFFFGMFAHSRPINRKPSQMDVVVSMGYCIVPSFMNPIIYSMRNKDIKKGMWKLIDWKFWGRTIVCLILSI